MQSNDHIKGFKPGKGKGGGGGYPVFGGNTAVYKIASSDF